MIEITAPTAAGDQDFRYDGETLVRLTGTDSVRGHRLYTVSWGTALGQIFRDAGEAFGYAMDRLEQMSEDVDTTARLRADMRS